MQPPARCSNHRCVYIDQCEHVDDFCEIVLILDLWFSRFHKKLFIIKSSTNPFFGEQNPLCHFGRGHNEEHFCENIFNLNQWFRRRRNLKTLFILSCCDPCIKPSKIVCAILVEAITRNICELLLKKFIGSGGNVIKRHFLSRALAALCSDEWNHLCNFGRRHREEQFCEIIMNLDQWFRRCQ